MIDAHCHLEQKDYDKKRFFKKEIFTISIDLQVVSDYMFNMTEKNLRFLIQNVEVGIVALIVDKSASSLNEIFKKCGNTQIQRGEMHRLRQVRGGLPPQNI